MPADLSKMITESDTYCSGVHTYDRQCGHYELERRSIAVPTREG